MSEYRRWYAPGGTFFFTVVTHDRKPIFHDRDAVRLLGDVMRTVRERSPFRTVAVVVLPDHLHCVWSLPDGDANFSGRWRRIKAAFTERWLGSGGGEGDRSASRARKGEHAIWQRRFWEHQVRDEEDLERHVDYIHYNPVKHGLVARPIDWPWSSFARHVALGQYPGDWGQVEPKLPNARPPE
ncbi:MAG: transposase [Isosphaeraceae bacterium]